MSEIIDKIQEGIQAQIAKGCKKENLELHIHPFIESRLIEIARQDSNRDDIAKIEKLFDIPIIVTYLVPNDSIYIFDKGLKLNQEIYRQTREYSFIK